MIVHLNGRLVPRDEARISPFDRGFIFGDGVYEGLRTIGVSAPPPPPPSTTPRGTHTGGARVIGLQAHIERLRAGMTAARFNLGQFDPQQLGAMTNELLAANRLHDAFVYWQFTRGTPGPGEPPRQRVPPAAGLHAGLTVFGYCAPQPSLEQVLATGPVSKRCAVLEDPRWRMGHLKSTSLMGNVVSAIEADHRACEDAIYIRNGVVSEGLATNVLLLTPRGQWVTPSLDSASMLAGVTRAVLIDAGERGHGPRIEVREVTTDELFDAREIVLTGSSTMVASVTSLVTEDDAQRSGGTMNDDANMRVVTHVDRVDEAGQDGARDLLATLVQSIRDGADERLPSAHMQGRHWRGFGGTSAVESADRPAGSTRVANDC